MKQLMCRCGSARSNDGGALKAVLWLVGGVGFLAYFTIGGFHNGQPAGRNKTTASLAAITGDGSDYLKTDGTGVPSDGILDAKEMASSINGNLPPQMIFSRGKSKGAPGPRYLVDGYGRPFQYTKGGHADAVSEQYDVWSYADAPDGLASRDLATKKGSQKSASWIKNW